MAPSRSSASVDEKDEKRAYATGVSVTTKEVDSAAAVSLGLHGAIDPKEAERIRWVLFPVSWLDN